MTLRELYTAQFDVVSAGGRRRFSVGTEARDREPDSSIPTEAWFEGEEYRLDVEGDGGISVYVKRL